MKKPKMTIIGVACLSLLIGTGCSDSNNTNPGGSAAQSPETSAPAPTLEEKVQDMGDTAKKAINDAASKADDIIAKAQSLVNEKNYTEAANLLQQLANIQLTPEQQKLVDNLKATIQKAAQSKAVDEGAKAIGNLMGGESK